MPSGPLRLHFYENLTQNYLGSIEDVIEAQIVIDQIDRAEAHTVRLAAIHAQAILAFGTKVRVDIEDVGDGDAGIVARGIVMNPSLAIARTGVGEFTLTILPLTEELHWLRTGYGYADTNALATIVSNLGGRTTYERSSLDYTQIDPQGFAGYDPAGTGYTKTTITPGQATGWSASFIPDGTFSPSNAPVVWTTLPDITATGNSVKKNMNAVDGWSGATGLPMATDAGHDFAFSFTVVDPGPYQVVGLTPFPAFTANAVAFGFDFTGGMWRILENGAIPTGTGAQTATFFPNTRFTIAWNSASQQIIYYVSAPAQYDYAFISNHAGAMPLVPHALMYTHGAEVLNAQIAATVATGQQWWKLRSDGLSIWGAILQLATDTDYHVRQGRDAAGGPNRSVEFGPFGTQSTCRFVDGMGGDVQQMTLVPNHRVIAAITQTGPDATTLVNLTTPMGGGGSNPVTLEHLWRILNDPRYENYGRYPGGYRSSAGIVFPEYNAAFPIYRRGMAVGGYEYYVVHRDSVAQYGEMQGGGADSQYSYTDPNPSTATKELTERALYVSAVGKLTSAGEPHLTLTFETDGRGKPVRAGDYAYVEYHSYGNVNGIPFQRLDVDDWFQVLRCTRAYATSGGVTDTWLVSNNGKYRSTDATFAADQARQLAAVQTTTQANTSMFIWPTTFRELDSLNDVVVDLRILPNVTRCQSAYLRVRFEQYRQTISLAQNSDATITIPIPHGFHRVNPVAGSSFIPTGILTSTETPGLPIHVHPISVINQTRNLSIPSVPYNAAPDRYLWMGGDGESVTVFSNGHSGTIYTLQPPGTGANAVDLTPAKHPHTAPIQQSLDNEYPTTLTGPLPQHTHALTSAILLKDRPAAIQVWIDNGSGQFANVTPELMNQVSNTQGGAGFTSDFEVEISRYFTQPGRVARIRFVSIGNGSNPQGLGAIAYSGTFAFEFNGLATTALLQL